VKPILFSLFIDLSFAEKIIHGIHCETGEFDLHEFPDAENSITIKSNIKGKNIFLLADLGRPNAKILMLVFFAELAKELGAKKITLITPYLSYMRQDKRSHPGEAISAQYFAKLLSNYFDAIITIEPHLHGYHSLNEIFTIPGVALRATQQVAGWIKSHIENPLIIGPDSGAKEWAEEIAQNIHAPCITLEKIRKGDRSVAIKLPKLDHYKDLTPVLVDDIISTGKTMIETVKALNAIKMKRAVCIAVHGVFADNAYLDLAAHVCKVVTCNTIKHVSNEIDISEVITDYLIKN
jgi:ribose-phosphate pyrophosphokinase